MVGKGNESDIIIEGSHTRGLIDTGSMISSISEVFPVIVGTNIIRQYKNSYEESDDVPEEWNTAFLSVCSDRIGVVKSTAKIVLQPLETKTITGLTRKMRNAEAAVTEPSETGASNVTVCPRVVRLDKPGTTARVPVRLFNITAKVVTIPAKSNICSLEEVKVLKSDPLADKHHSATPAYTHQQTTSVNNKTGVDLEDTSLSQEQKQQVLNFLSQWQSVFSQGPNDSGRTNLVEHEIHLETEQPFKEPHRKIPPALLQEVREHLKEMLEIGAIREFNSPFSSNIVLVRKKDGSIRFCIDYRKLNQRTIKDAYAIPRIDDTLHLLAGSKYFPLWI